jgi:SAM-dependent methyltransferase
MRLSTWTEAGFGAIDDEIAGAFEPLVQKRAERGDPDWSRHIWKRRRRILRTLFKRQIGDPQSQYRRDTAAIQEEYDFVWNKGFDRYQMRPDVHPKPWTWRGRQYWSNSIAATRFRQVILARVLERTRPRNVLEVGCGNGINLILLACRFPDIQFTGLELTAAGHESALQFLEAHEVLPAPMRAFAPLPLSDLGAFRRVRFVRGSAEKLPFPDGAFDLTMTILALEQMEQIRAKAISEVARATGRYALLFEPFYECNARLWLRLNRMKRGYFAGRIRDLNRYNLDPEFAIDDYPQEVFLHTCAVLCRKGSVRGGS